MRYNVFRQDVHRKNQRKNRVYRVESAHLQSYDQLLTARLPTSHAINTKTNHDQQQQMEITAYRDNQRQACITDRNGTGIPLRQLTSNTPLSARYSLHYTVH
jgi:hypothetical protein